LSSRPVLYLEPVGGVAGDMFLAAALDLGVKLEALEQPLHSLGVGGWHFEVKKDERHHLVGTHVDVVVDETQHEHEHRSLTEIQALIQASQLPERAKERALKVFHAIGVAEAKIHGTTVEQIHFHEVGAVDSIVDICGAAMALELLEDPEVFCAPPPLGSGEVKIAHGVVPVPVPATLELLTGVPVRFEGQGELTTPTGAALVKVLTQVTPPPPLVVERVGYGVGTKDWSDRANVLRASLGKRAQAADHSGASTLTVLEANLDDCSPQVLGALVETLLEDGALDAWIVPAVMKKGRPGHLVGVLCESGARDELTRRLFTETTTLGVRASTVERTAVERRHVTVNTKYGDVRVKVGRLDGKDVTVMPEFEDCKALAKQVGKPLKVIQAAAIHSWHHHK